MTSKCMVEKIAGSGLSYKNLKDIFDKYDRRGLVRALSTSPTGFKKPSVTKKKRILLAIVRAFLSIIRMKHDCDCTNNELLREHHAYKTRTCADTKFYLAIFQHIKKLKKFTEQLF